MKKSDILANIVLIFSILSIGNGISKEIKSHQKEVDLSPKVISMLDDTSSRAEEAEKRIEELKTVISKNIEQNISNLHPVIKDNKIINVAYLTHEDNVYDKEGNIIDYIDIYQKVFLFNTKGSNNYIQYLNSNNELVKGYIDKSSIEILPDTYIEIDIESQELNMYIDGVLSLSSPIVSGMAYSSPTGIGYFEIYYKEESAILKSYYDDGTLRYESYVDYWMPFDGGIGLHDAEFHTHENGFSHGWRSIESFGNNTYLYNGSHGCVNLPNLVAQFIYNNSEVGTKVLVHK